MKHCVLNFDLICFFRDECVLVSPAGRPLLSNLLTQKVSAKNVADTLVFLAKHSVNVWLFTNRAMAYHSEVTAPPLKVKHTQQPRFQEG